VKRWLAVVVTLASFAIDEPALAAGPLSPEGTPITTSEYRVDLTQGVVLAGTRVLGLAGAYVAIAEGVDGNSQNAAAPAVRAAYSFDHFDYDLGFGLTFPAAISGNDFFNRGDASTLSRSQKGFVFLNIAANAQFGRWGLGAALDYQSYELRATQNQGYGLNARFGGVRISAAHAFDDGQIIFGIGSRGTGLVVEQQEPGSTTGKSLFDMEGAALELGGLWRPNDQPFRVGAALRSAVLTTRINTDVPKNANGDRVVSAGSRTLFLPNQVELPWDANVGVALQLGRPFNPRWIDPAESLARLDRFVTYRNRERKRTRDARIKAAIAKGSTPVAATTAVDAEIETEEALDGVDFERAERAVRIKLKDRYARMQRFYVLVSTSLLVTGPVENGVGVESFLEGSVQRSGRRTTYSPRLGIESEVVPAWLTLRAGTYGEPTRFENEEASPRLHGTTGFDLKLFPWTVFGLFEDGTSWRLSAALDAAQRYFSWGVSIGVWH
jgi:hypothetical protein